MAEIWQTKELVAEINNKVKTDIDDLKAAKGIVPGLAIVRVGESPDAISYERSIVRSSDRIGIRAQVFASAADVSLTDFTALIARINNDKEIHGILMFRPLPAQLDYNVIKHLINPAKDIDCINPLNLAKVFQGETDVLFPTTSEAVIEICRHFQGPLTGCSVAVVNRSMVVGRPLAMMLLNENATVTICHSKTHDLPAVTAAADIVVAAVGRANFFGPEFFRAESLVVDVGINVDEEGRLVGDVDYQPVSELVKAITPVPGGVGPMNTALLLRNVLTACRRQTAAVPDQKLQ